jgi:hypothetical protein
MIVLTYTGKDVGPVNPVVAVITVPVELST